MGKTEWHDISPHRKGLGCNVAERIIGIFSLIVYEDLITMELAVTTHPLVLSERLGKVGEMSQAQAKAKAERRLRAILTGAIEKI